MNIHLHANPLAGIYDHHSVVNQDSNVINNLSNRDHGSSFSNNEANTASDENPSSHHSSENSDLERQEQQQEQKRIQALAQRDKEVKAHEQAHAAVGGQYTSAPRYEFEKGPNGVQYAVAGDVSIDVSPIPGDPEATLEKAMQVKRAALAPAQPSAQDRKVAAEAQQMITEARNELTQQQKDMLMENNQSLSSTEVTSTISIYV